MRNNHDDDDYVLPPQDRNDAPEIRPRKVEKGSGQDMYDEDHYSLARNSGFGKDFVNTSTNSPTVPSNTPGQRKLKCTHITIICLIVVVLGIGGGLAYLLIDRIGKVPSSIQHALKSFKFVMKMLISIHKFISN